MSQEHIDLKCRETKLEDDQKRPHRRCIVTREILDTSELLRFVVDPNGFVIFDLKRKLPGRGVWVQAQKKFVNMAVQKHLFRKAFRKDVNVNEDIGVQIETVLIQDALQSLGFANKAGAIVQGFTKIAAALGKRNIIALIHAIEAQPDGREKLSKKRVAAYGDMAGPTTLADCFSSNDLSQICGTSNVMHIGLKNTGISVKVLQDIKRLVHYQGK